MAKPTRQIRPEVEAYVKAHYTTTEDISCSRCGRDDQECPIYFGPTFLGTLQGRRPNYNPLCWEDAIEFEMNARVDSGEWDPDLDDADEAGEDQDMTTYENCPVCQNINGAGLGDCLGHEPVTVADYQAHERAYQCPHGHGHECGDGFCIAMFA